MPANRRTRRALNRITLLLSIFVMAASGSIASLQAQVQIAGLLYVDLRATHPSAGSATWTNQGALVGNFAAVDSPAFVSNVLGTATPGVFFDGANDAYLGPLTVADIDGAGDRSVEVWAYNPSLASEETTVSWGHRGTSRRNMGFNFGNNTTWGAATHWGDDVSWGTAAPGAGAWRHLAYTYSNSVVRVYIDGALANSRTLGGPLDTFPGEAINLACQRESSGVRSFFFSGYLNTVRIHGGVLSASQVQWNYLLGPVGGPTNPPPAPTGLVLDAGFDVIHIQWDAAPGATRYQLKRSIGGGPYAILATNLISPSYLDAGLAPGTNYQYVVAAANMFGLSDDSASVSGTPGFPSQVAAAGALYVDLRATHASAGSAVWTNQGSLGHFTAAAGAPALVDAVGQKGIPGVFFNGSTAYEGPVSAPDLDAGSDRSIEVWAYNPSLATEETVASWAHRGTTRRNVALNFGSHPTWGAATHWGDDVPWGTPPGANEWHHLVYTYENGVVRVYIDGVLSNTRILGGALNTFAGDPINIGCQREAGGTRSLFYSGYINTVRIHGGVLNPAQIQANYYFGADAPPPAAVDDQITMNPGAKALIPVTANDIWRSVFPGTVALVNPPSAGTASVDASGRILYTHNGSGSSDAFTYRLQNVLGQTSAVATVSVTISTALRLPNTTVTVPNQPPAIAFEIVDALPGLTFPDPVAMRSPPGNSNQLFVVERRGVISYVPDIRSPTPVRLVFMDIQNQVDDSTGDTGLLGLEFHPGFNTNGFFYVSYIAPGGSPFIERLARFTANPATLTVNTNTQQLLISVIDEYFDHNGGDLHFGPDGYLYVSMGDEGRHYNIQQNAQRIDKDFYSGILRLDVDKRPGSLEPTPHYAIPTNALGQAFYSIPADNPFVGATELNGQPINTNALRAEFYAIGLRHVWRMSIDPLTGEVWAPDVGQDRRDEVNVIEPGGNYGWAYFEASRQANLEYPAQPTLTNPPPGFNHILPIWEYTHLYVNDSGDPNYKGNAIIGGPVYRGSRFPSLVGAYICGDFASGNLWALRRTNGSVTVERLAGEPSIAALGVDAGNGDVLIASYSQGKIKRLVRAEAPASEFPQKLSDTGVFADLATLTPNPGIVSYEPKLSFWSDYAIKRRWFTIPDATNSMTFARDSNWLLPTGTKWIKHFDLELERGNVNSPKRRLETRILVKTAEGAYGVSYRWNDAQDEAFLADETGETFNVPITVGGVPANQVWEIPSRVSCLACHTPAGGHSLTFNTREMNCTATLNGVTGNQLDLLAAAGYFDAPVPSSHTLPVFAAANDSSASLEFRVRSYLAVNCVQCHQSGGSAPTLWDARPYLPLAQTALISATPHNDGGDPASKVIVPGDLAHSILWQRLQGSNGFGRMPPLATHQLDQAAIQLVADWITQELPSRLTYGEWIAQYPSLTGPAAQPGADPDADGASNHVEYLTGGNPLNSVDAWKLAISTANGLVNIGYNRVPNLGIVIESSLNLLDWTVWDVPGNQPFFPSASGTTQLQGPLGQGPQFFRARFVEP